MSLCANLWDAEGRDRTERLVRLSRELASGRLGRFESNAIGERRLVEVPYGESHVFLLACGAHVKRRLCRPGRGDGWQPLYDHSTCRDASNASVLPFPHLSGRGRVWKSPEETRIYRERASAFFAHAVAGNNNLVAFTLGNLLSIASASKVVGIFDMWDERHRLAEAWLRDGKIPEWAFRTTTVARSSSLAVIDTIGRVKP